MCLRCDMSSPQVLQASEYSWYYIKVEGTNQSVVLRAEVSDPLAISSSMASSTLHLLPKCEYKREQSSDDNELVLKAKLHTRDDCIAWVQEFEKLTKTKWIVQHSDGESQRIVCRKQYLCHHSSHGKKNTSRKNLNCLASLSVVIMKRAKDGYPAKITMKGEHSHAAQNADVLATLPASESTRVTFEEYFCRGMGITEAINFHRRKLELECDEEEFFNGSINPKYRTVQHWYHKWKELNFGPRAGEDTQTKTFKEKQSDYEKIGTQIQEDFHINSESNSDMDPNGSWHDKLHNLINSVMSTYKSSDIVAKQLVQRLQNVKSDLTLDKFLSTAGFRIRARNRRATGIRVQPAAITTKPGVTRSLKRLASGQPLTGMSPRKKQCSQY